jgi:uncharacterized membrane protein
MPLSLPFFWFTVISANQLANPTPNYHHLIHLPALITTITITTIIIIIIIITASLY